MLSQHTWLGLLATFLLPASLCAQVDFSREILPVLSDTCFQCHGPDPKSRKGDLRLDDEGDAKRKRDGYAIVMPGKSSASELLKRLITDDPDDKMPPPELGRSVAPEVIEKIRQWIDEGAKWGPHWSLTQIKRPALPMADMHPVDSFLTNRIEAAGLSPTPRAPRTTLIRRLHQDLTGLPPTPKEVDEFLADKRPDAWKQLIHKVMGKQAYGERMAWNWLDASRYADSNGYQGDMERTMWPWRDWVVKAFNDNMRWDQFTEWQLAGDLYPNATYEQKLATGFNRNHMINGEGGRIPEENRVDYVMDMTETMGTVWLGLTFNCSRCHDHKFDAITQRDYYSLSAYFNQTPVTGSGRSPKTAPILKAPSAVQKESMDSIRAKIARLEAAAAKRAREIVKDQAAWEEEMLTQNNQGATWEILQPTLAKAKEQTLTIQKDKSILVGGKKRPKNDTYTVQAVAGGKKVTGFRLEALKHKSLTKGGLSRSGSANFVLTEFEAKVAGKALKFASATATFEQGGLKVAAAIDGKKDTGWAVWDGRVVDREHTAVFRLQEPYELPAKSELNFTLRHDSKHAEHLLGCFRISLTTDDEPRLTDGSEKVLAALKTPKEKRSKEQASLLVKEHRARDKAYGVALYQVTQEKDRLSKIDRSLPLVMVMEDMKKPRDTFILTRGAYNKPDEKVTMAVPASLHSLPKDAPKNRGGLAKWLTARENPLMARVIVNRFWQQIFGMGIVKTSEDFGVQGEFPKHPELLDWLAAEFVDSGWDVKHLLEVILTSSAYQRSSTVTPELLEADPENRLLARGVRYRMPSWMIRDQALAASGLLNDKIGGAPVNVYQPAGIWEEATFGKKKYVQDHGDKLYRRSLYVFWRRIVGPTMFFDTAARQICEVKTPRTNTPLHALSTLNDITYVEAARAMAERLFREAKSDVARLRRAYRLVLARNPNEQELNIWKRGLERARKQFAAEKDSAGEFLKVGESQRDESLDPVEHAALAAVCLGILNLDEALNKE
ncbi:MAG: PSD1 and planctomycete cytochrome C domain-containing protein [Limisphaerales bacterium]